MNKTHFKAAVTFNAAKDVHPLRVWNVVVFNELHLAVAGPSAPAAATGGAPLNDRTGDEISIARCETYSRVHAFPPSRKRAHAPALMHIVYVGPDKKTCTYEKQ
jgi:hypothetical protein